MSFEKAEHDGLLTATRLLHRLYELGLPKKHEDEIIDLITKVVATTQQAGAQLLAQKLKREAPALLMAGLSPLTVDLFSACAELVKHKDAILRTRPVEDQSEAFATAWLEMEKAVKTIQGQ